jgi:hypothetical protein
LISSGAVDLVGQEEVAEDRSQFGIEALASRLVDAGPDEVGGDEVGGELHPAEAPTQDARGRLDRQRLRETGNALDQQVAAGEQTDEDALEHLVLAGDDALDLEERLLELFPGLAGTLDYGQLAFVRQARSFVGSFRLRDGAAPFGRRASWGRVRHAPSRKAADR